MRLVEEAVGAARLASFSTATEGISPNRIAASNFFLEAQLARYFARRESPVELPRQRQSGSSEASGDGAACDQSGQETQHSSPPAQDGLATGMAKMLKRSFERYRALAGTSSNVNSFLPDLISTSEGSARRPS